MKKRHIISTFSIFILLAFVSTSCIIVSVGLSNQQIQDVKKIRNTIAKVVYKYESHGSYNSPQDGLYKSGDTYTFTNYYDDSYVISGTYDSYKEKYDLYNIKGLSFKTLIYTEGSTEIIIDGTKYHINLE